MFNVEEETPDCHCRGVDNYVEIYVEQTDEAIEFLRRRTKRKFSMPQSEISLLNSCIDGRLEKDLKIQGSVFNVRM